MHKLTPEKRKDILHNLINKINDELYKERVETTPNYDRAKDFYIEARTDDEVSVIANTLVKISRFTEGRSHGDTNKGRKKKLLKDIEDLEKQLYMFGFIDEAIDYLRPIKAKVKRSEIKSEKQQVLSIAEYTEKELHSIGSSSSTINEVVTFIKKALPEIARYREYYEDELDKLQPLV